jgi:hypothetical protein
MLDIDERLSSYYDYIRKQLFLNQKLENLRKDDNCIDLKLVKVDHSARMYKHKYLLEKPYMKIDQQFLRQYLLVHVNAEEKENKTL